MPSHGAGVIGPMLEEEDSWLLVLLVSSQLTLFVPLYWNQHEQTTATTMTLKLISCSTSQPLQFLIPQRPFNSTGFAG